MTQESLSVFVLSCEYSIVDAPEPLRDDEGEACSALVDHDQQVIWVDRSLSPRRRLRMILQAVSRAWTERLQSIPSTEQ